MNNLAVGVGGAAGESGDWQGQDEEAVPSFLVLSHSSHSLDNSMKKRILHSDSRRENLPLALSLVRNTLAAAILLLPETTASSLTG